MAEVCKGFNGHVMEGYDNFFHVRQTANIMISFNEPQNPPACTKSGNSHKFSTYFCFGQGMCQRTAQKTTVTCGQISKTFTVAAGVEIFVGDICWPSVI